MYLKRNSLLAGAAVLALSLAAVPAFASSGMCKDTSMKADNAMSGDTMGQDSMAKSDAMGSDAMASSDAMGKSDTMGSDNMGSGNMAADSMGTPDAMAKPDGMAAGDAMASNDTMGSDNMGSNAMAAHTMDYTVKQGDSLWSIAAAQLCDGARYTEIVAANKDVLGGKMMLQAGQVLRIPGD
jgi:pentapeptide MXKDX repeat protein